MSSISGWWWLEHFFLFVYILRTIIPNDSYFSEGFKPPARSAFNEISSWVLIKMCKSTFNWCSKMNTWTHIDKTGYQWTSIHVQLFFLRNLQKSIDKKWINMSLIEIRPSSMALSFQTWKKSIDKTWFQFKAI